MDSKTLKIFSRLCKEINIFPSRYFKNIFKYINESNSCIFYGRDAISYTSDDVEIIYYKLQLDFIKRLIEENLLSEKDFRLAAKDTLCRYNFKLSSRFNSTWKYIVKSTGKKDFVDFFTKKYKDKLTEEEIDHLKDLVSY